jgi:hypothetical protein
MKGLLGRENGSYCLQDLCSQNDTSRETFSILGDSHVPKLSVIIWPIDVEHVLKISQTLV